MAVWGGMSDYLLLCTKVLLYISFGALFRTIFLGFMNGDYGAVPAGEVTVYGVRTNLLFGVS